MTLRAPRILVSVAAATCVLTAVSCASGPGGSSASTCTSDLPRDQRSLNEVVDSTALLADLSTRWQVGAGLTLARIPYDSIGNLDTVRVVSRGLVEASRNELGERIGRHARPTGEARTTVALFVADDAGPAPRRVPDLRTCAPTMLNRSFVADVMTREAMRLSLSSSTVVRLFALVDVDGSVREVRIDRPSNNSLVDEAAVRVAELATFSPGRTEGIVTPVWVNFPVTFQVVPPGQQRQPELE